VKRSQTDWLVEKATELGAARLVPVITKRTIVERVKIERLETIAIEAAEQCGRTRLPRICEPLPLERFLAELESGRTLYFADEAGGKAAADAFTASRSPSARASCARKRRRSRRSASLWRTRETGANATA
jgi:16S rRNA (uracil1498-N3)-methyltransferase